MVLNAILLWSLTVSTVLYFFLILMLILMFHAPVAQLVEHRAVTREVVSSHTSLFKIDFKVFNGPERHIALVTYCKYCTVLFPYSNAYSNVSRTGGSVG